MLLSALEQCQAHKMVQETVSGPQVLFKSQHCLAVGIPRSSSSVILIFHQSVWEIREDEPNFIHFRLGVILIQFGDYVHADNNDS